MLRCGKTFLAVQQRRIGYPRCMRIIKKYSNRRLYDTQTSAYVNLEQIATLVRGGEEIKVISVSDGEDLTRAVLLQVVMEQRGGASLFPVGLLHRIIRFSGETAFHRALNQQLSVGMELLDAQLMRFERQFGWMRGEAPPEGAPPDREPAPPESAPEEPPVPETGAEAGSADAELDALRARLEALEGRLKNG
jgi:polyhydroxyalkanoate synthesis repressor PhaR